jgi:tRNA(adenine34) deaminase
VNLDEYFMKEALKEAEKGFAAGEVPVGAVLVLDGEIIARASNRVEADRDATSHAESLRIKMASAHLQNWRLLNTTLYTTLEPCSMCAGALLLSRVLRVVWGAKDLRHGAGGSWVDILTKAHPIHTIEVRGGVLAEESAAVLKKFFRQRRSRHVTDV